MCIKIVLDTDIGTDIDDALCLTYLLANPACDLLGITTVTGEPEKRAMLASALCKLAGKEIPIYPGAAKPILIEQRQKTAAQARALKKWKHDTDFPRNQAIDFLRNTIRENPGEVNLLTIGPLTNIGLLFASDREIPSLLKSLVMMAGHFERRNPLVNTLEWNAFGDAHASAIVYQSLAPVHRSIGLDVTHQVTMHAEQFRREFSHELFAPVRDFAEVWFEYSPIITFHDPLAATTLFDETICQFSRGEVSIELADQKNLGLTHWQTKADGNHEVALEVNGDRFFEHYLSFFK